MSSRASRRLAALAALLALAGVVWFTNPSFEQSPRAISRPEVVPATGEALAGGSLGETEENSSSPRVPVAAVPSSSSDARREIVGQVVLPAGVAVDRALRVRVRCDDEERDPVLVGRDLGFVVPIPEGVEQATLDLDDAELYLPAPKRVYSLEPPISEVLLEAERYGRIEVYARCAPEAAGTDSLEVMLTTSEPEMLMSRAPGPAAKKIAGIGGSCLFESLRSDQRYMVNCTGSELALPAQVCDIEVRPGETTRVDLVLECGASVIGHVLTQDGRPVPGVRVTAGTAAPGRAERWPATTTAKEGAYRLARVPVGKVELRASVPPLTRHGDDDSVSLQLRSADGAQLVLTQELEWIEAGEERTVDWIVPAVGDFHGRVMWPDGRPASGASVFASTGEEEGDAQLDSYVSGRTGYLGGFSIRARLGNEISVLVMADGEEGTEGCRWFADWRGPLTEIDKNVDLVLERGVQVHGRVEDPAGAPVPAFHLSWNAQSASGLASKAGIDSFPATDGRLSLCVPHGGSLVVRAYEDPGSRFGGSYNSAIDNRLVVTERDEGFVLRVPPVSVVSGLVVDASNRLLKSVPVELHWEASQSDADGRRNSGAFGHATDAEGAFQFAQSIPESDVRVFVTGEPGTVIEIHLSPGEIRQDLVIYL